MDVGLTGPQDRAPNRDRRVEIAVVAEVADRAAVQAAALALRRGDQLHRPDLGSTREGARREHRPQRIERVEVRLEAALDVRHEMEDVAVALDLHVLADGHGAGPRDPPQIVPPEVDEHDVLRSFFRVALELLGEDPVVRVGRATRSRARDRVGRQLVALDLEEELRARTDDLERRRPDEEQVRARVDATEGAVEGDPVERLASGRVGRQVERLAPGEDDLNGLSGSDRVFRDLDGVDVGVTAEARVDPVVAEACRSGQSRSTRSAHLGRAGPGRPLQCLEDRRLGNPVAALEVRRLGVERRDRRERVGEVVEDEDEVGLDEGGRRRPTGSRSGSGTLGSKIETAS